MDGVFGIARGFFRIVTAATSESLLSFGARRE
jgi:hypothetical protein